MSHPDLKTRLAQPSPLLAPGVYDALSALVAQQVGFEAVLTGRTRYQPVQFGAFFRAQVGQQFE